MRNGHMYYIIYHKHSGQMYLECFTSSAPPLKSFIALVYGQPHYELGSYSGLMRLGMSCKLLSPFEGFIAQVALEWFLSSVNHHVLL